MAQAIKGIAIQIGAETTGFKNGLKELDKSAKGLQSELSAVNRALKHDPKNVELLKQKQELLTKSVAETKTKLDVLKAAKDKADADMANGTEINQEEYRKLQREISFAQTRLESLQDQTKEFGSVSQQQLRAVGDKFSEVGGKMESAGKKMSAGITAPILGIAAASQIAFNEVDAALDTIVTKTGATGEAIDGLNASFENIYSTMPVDAQAVGDAIGEVNTQFALTGDALEKASEQIIKFSQINGQDVTSSTTSSKAAMDAFQLSADDLDSTLDAVTKTAQNTGVGTDKLFESVTKGAPQLKELGLDFAQSTAVMGGFEQSGIDSTKALSYLSKAQVTFAKDGQTLSDGLGGLIEKIQNSSSETEALTTASEYFGTKGASFMLDAIQRGAFSFDDFAGAAESAAGSVTSTFEGTLSPVNEFTTSMNNLKLVGADLSSAFQEALLPMLQGLTEKLKAFSEWFGNLSPGMKDMIVKVGLVAAAIGPLLVVVGTLISSINTIIAFAPTLTAAFSAVKVALAAIGGPITIVMALIGALIAYFVHLYQTNEEFRDKVNAVFEKVKEIVSGAVTAVKEKIKEFVDVGKNVIEGIWNGITDKVDWLKGKVTGVVDKIKGWFTNADGFDTHSPSKWSEKIAKWVMQGLGNGFKDNSAAVAAKNAVSNIKTIFAKAAEQSRLSLEEVQTNIKTLTDKLSGYGSLFTTAEGENGAEYQVNSLKDYIGVLGEYQNVIEGLKAKGVDEGILSEMENMSIDDAIGYGQQLLEMDKGAFDEYNALWVEKQQKAKEIAESLYKSELDLLSEDFNGKLDSELSVLKDTTFATGADSILSLIDGMNSQENAAISAAKALGGRIASALSAAKEDDSDDADGSHKNGLWRVPFDGYRAIVHTDEAILNAAAAAKWRSGNTTTTTNNKTESFVVNIAKVENSNGRTTQDLMREMEFYRKSKVAAVGGA